MANPYAVKTLINRMFAGRFFIAKLSHIPIIGKILDDLLFAEDDILYLPADRAIPVNRRLAPRQNMVLPSRVLDEIIDRASHHWIMDFCICRDSADCKAYPKNLGCLFMAVSIVFTAFVNLNDPKKQIKPPNIPGWVLFLSFGHLNFEFVSDFGFNYSMGPGYITATIFTLCAGRNV